MLSFGQGRSTPLESIYTYKIMDYFQVKERKYISEITRVLQHLATKLFILVCSESLKYK